MARMFIVAHLLAVLLLVHHCNPQNFNSRHSSRRRPTSSQTGISFGGSSNSGSTRHNPRPHSQSQSQPRPSQVTHSRPSANLGRDIQSIRGCFCIPSNQICDPRGVIPKKSTKISAISPKIVNSNPDSDCPQDDKPCCFASEVGSGPTPPKNKPPGLEHCGSNGAIFSGRRGTAEADFGEYPWMAVITTRDHAFIATGALIGSNWILTAAHKLLDPNTYVVRVGDYDLASPNEFPNYPHQTFNVAEVIFHPQFNPQNLFNDIALIRLDRHVRLAPNVQPVCVPEQAQTFIGKRCYVSGWGIDQSGRFSQIMREVDVPVVDSSDCSVRLRETGELGSRFRLNPDSFMCAGGEAGKDACRGDGGAPLVCEEFEGTYTVVGLVAWGLKTCGRNLIPGVYVNVAGFSNFINSYV